MNLVILITQTQTICGMEKKLINLSKVVNSSFTRNSIRLINTQRRNNFDFIGGGVAKAEGNKVF